MKRTIKTTIKTIATAVLIAICACLFGSTKVSAAEPTAESEFESVIDMTQVTGFVVNNGNLQLYFIDGTEYYWEKDIDSVNVIVHHFTSFKKNNAQGTF